MSFLTRVLFERPLTDKLAADDNHTLPIVAGSGMALAGAGVPITLRKIIINSAAKFDEPRYHAMDQEHIASKALHRLNLTRPWVELDLRRAKAELQDLRSYVDKGKNEVERLQNVAKAEATIKELEHKIATIDKFIPKHQGKISALQAEIKNLEAMYKNTLGYKLNHLPIPEKYWKLTRAGIIGLPIALTVGGVGLAGYNLYKRHQEKKPWYEKLKDGITIS